MADKKVSELTAITNLSGDDLLLVVNDPSGTPSSNKVTISRLFANVVPATTHKGAVTFKANTTFSGTKITSTANVSITGGLSVNSTAVLPALQDRMQVANTTLLVNDRMQVSNALSLIYDRMQKANAISIFANSQNGLLRGTTSAQNMNANTVTIRANTGLVVSISGGPPSSNNTTTEGWTVGTMIFANNYLYIAVDPYNIKRVPLEVFS